MKPDDDDLTSDERAALAELPREAMPRSPLEDRVVARLRAYGLVRPRRRRTTVVRAAGAIVLVAAGFAIGRATAATTAGSSGSQFMLLLYGAQSATPAEETARATEYGAWARRQLAGGRLVAADSLARTTDTLGSATAPAGGSGPVGFFLIRAASAEEARQIAAGCPHLRHGGTVVVQPVGAGVRGGT